MSKDIRIKRGVDIKLKGRASNEITGPFRSETFALKPSDFHGVIPKLLVKEGDEVKAGTPIFYSSASERVMFSSPVSGEIASIQRGAKRVIERIVILADKEDRFEDFGAVDPSGMNREAVIEKMLSAGVWPFIRQRPYNVIALPDDTPKAIFISGFDSNPLAPSLTLITEGQEEDFQAGIDVLAKLTSGKIHLSVHKELGESSAYRNVKGVEKHTISGPHPSGNVGVQIHYIDPINKGEKVWFVAPQDLLIIGRLFRTGHYNPAITIALTGSEVKEPRYVRTTKGVCVAALLHNGLVQDNVRVISGNVFTGGKIPVDGYLRAYDQQITVIPEENEPEFFGWALPRMHKFSLSKAYFSWLTPNKEYRLTTSANGEKRAFVVTGEYEKVFPMDIYPAQLVKSVLMNDIEAMENLGIYEVSEEDFALAEFSCTSKMELQKIVREGMDMMITEMGV